MEVISFKCYLHSRAVTSHSFAFGTLGHVTESFLSNAQADCLRHWHRSIVPSVQNRTL